jgi:small subunit ribosomal protein S8
MVVTDPIADMLTRIRNAQVARHEEVLIPASNMKKSIARILRDEGYIKSYEVVEEAVQGSLKLKLKYTGGSDNVIAGLKRISRPGLRVYARKDKVPRVLGGLGIAIMSTSKGVMTDKQARQNNVGGEVLAYIW